MIGKCKHEGCYPDTACALGHLDRTECEHWISEEETKPDSDIDFDSSDIPWNSYSLGMDDLSILGGRGRPIVVGLVGAPNSGKTSLLTFLYMWLLEKGKLFDWTFCGSWTLGAWESLVQNCRWSGEPPPSFPPHTTSSGRTPGLLHLALRNEQGFLRDVFFTDAPGEWFTKWAKSTDDKHVSGARWVFKYSNSLLLLTDQDALSSNELLPQARRNTRNLIERIGAVAPHIPLGFIWTKIDISLPSGIKKTIENSRIQYTPYSHVFETTTTKPETIAQTLFKIIALGEEQHFKVKISEPIFSSDPFLSYRGHHVKI